MAISSTPFQSHRKADIPPDRNGREQGEQRSFDCGNRFHGIAIPCLISSRAGGAFGLTEDLGGWKNRFAGIALQALLLRGPEEVGHQEQDPKNSDTDLPPTGDIVNKEGLLDPAVTAGFQVSVSDAVPASARNHSSDKANGADPGECGTRSRAHGRKCLVSEGAFGAHLAGNRHCVNVGWGFTAPGITRMEDLASYHRTEILGVAA